MLNIRREATTGHVGIYHTLWTTREYYSTTPKTASCFETIIRCYKAMQLALVFTRIILNCKSQQHSPNRSHTSSFFKCQSMTSTSDPGNLSPTTHGYSHDIYSYTVITYCSCSLSRNELYFKMFKTNVSPYTLYCLSKVSTSLTSYVSRAQTEPRLQIDSISRSVEHHPCSRDLLVASHGTEKKIRLYK